MKYQHLILLLVVLFCLTSPTFSFQKRNLAEAQPIRITIDNNTNTYQYQDAQFMNYLNDLLDVTKQYFNDFLLVNQPATLNEINLEACKEQNPEVNFEQYDYLENSDLHLVVNIIEDSTRPNLVVAKSCYNSSVTQRTTVGILTVNKALLNKSKFNRQLDHFKKALFRVLGFSKEGISRWENQEAVTEGPLYEGSNNNTLLLISDEAKNAFIQHTYCDTVRGVPLEINQTLNGIEYELEKTYFGNEILTGFFEQEPVIVSRISWAVLESSGWYTFNQQKQGELDQNLWGKNGQCNFIQSPLPTFNDNTPDFKCSATQFSIQVPASIPFYDSDRVWKTSKMCTNENQEKTLEDELSMNEFGQNSRCFSSTVKSDDSIESPVRCHNFLCGENSLIIQIDGQEFPCEGTTCQVETNNFAGAVTVSNADFRNLCQNQGPKPCPSCSGKGFCQMGRCFCKPGYSGKNCQSQCDGVLVNGECQTGNSCPGDLQLDPTTNTCNCPIGSYTQGQQCVDTCSNTHVLNKELGECVPCAEKCQTCSETPNNCSQCAQGYLTTETSNPQCVKSCPVGFVQIGDQFCLPCSDGCKKCESANVCLVCDQGQFVKEGICVNECGTGFYLEEQTQTCKACFSGCEQCFGPSEEECQFCDTSEKPVYFFGTCVAACPAGYFQNALRANTCDQCHPSCRTCDGPFENNCLSCPEAEIFNDAAGSQVEYKWYFIEEEQICTTSCRQFGYDFVDEERNLCLGCDDSCLTCYHERTRCSSCPPGLYWADFECLEECPQGYYQMQQTSECLRCSENCQSCENFEKCTICNEDFFLIDNFCKPTLPEGYFIDPTTGQPEKCAPKCAQCENQESCLRCFQGSFLNGETCDIECNEGYYPDYQQNQCKPCSEGCLVCENKHSCTTCSGDFVPIYDNNNNMRCSTQCQQGHFRVENGCAPCDIQTPNCKECNQSGQCIQCYGDFILNEDFLCQTPSECTEGTYPDTASNLCKPCHHNCASCFDQYNDTCNSCISGLFLAHQTYCSEVCPDGTIAQQGECVRCSQKCKTCAETTQFCTTCWPDYFLKDGDCVLDCGDGLYEDFNSSSTANSNPSCQPCDQGCAKCYGPQECAQCDENLVLFNGNCKEACPSKHFAVEGRCEKCSKNCEFCQSLEACEECASGYEVRQGYCVNTEIRECENSNQFLDPLTFQCLDCRHPCLTCYGPSSNQCLTCKDGLFQYNQQECLETCPEGTFYDTTQTYCFDCPEQCTVCTNFNSCQQCAPGFFLFEGKCKKSCPEGYYQDWQEQTCKQCFETCKKCYGSESDQCLACTDNYKTQQNPTNPDIVDCVDACEAGYFQTSDNRCYRCTEPCATCAGEGPNQCLTCLDTYFTVSSSTSDFVKCLEICPTGTYGDSNQQTCQPCIDNCQICQSSETCEICAPGFQLDPTNGQCTEGCLDGQFSATVSGTNNTVCLPCNQPCTTCSSSTVCTACDDGYRLSSNTGECVLDCAYWQQQGEQLPECQPCPSTCPDSCERRNGRQVCTECETGLFLLHGLCLERCPRNEGFFANQNTNTCDACIEGCAQCNHVDTCQVCFSGLFLSGDSCLQQCNDGYFANYETGNCKACSTGCATCAENPYYCLSCPSGKFLHQGQCVSQCPAGTYFDQNNMRCPACHPKCATCASADICSTCTEGYIFHQENCVRGCPEGFFKKYYNNQDQCFQCAAGCQTCVRNMNLCTSCEDGYYLNPNTKVCSQDVPSGYFFNQETGQLEKCQVVGCLTCVSADTCETCESQQPFNPATGKCPCTNNQYTLNINDVTICVPEGQCPEGYYHNSNAMMCDRCNPICKTCSDGQSCISCRDDRQAGINGECLCKEGTVQFRDECYYNCPNGFYADDNQTCQVCSLNCTSCSATECLSCGSGFVLIDGQCLSLDNCPNGTYPDRDVNECLPCPQGCTSCDANKECLTCEQQHFLVDGTCSRWCPYLKYPDYSSYTCIDCEPHCIECNEQDCYWCENGFFLLKTEGQQRRSCVQSCPEGKYAEQAQNECLSCTQHCLSCQDQYVCNECAEGFTVVDGVCQRGCPKGQFLVDNQCQSCGDGCAQCDSQGNCYQCQDGFLTQFSFDSATNNESVTCVEECQPGYVQEGNYPYCYPCHPFCAICTGYNNQQCSECNEGYLAANGGCYEFCPQGYFQSANGQCSECDQSCASCSDSATNCKECASGLILTLENTCVGNCPSGTFAIQDQFCEPCPHNCLTCDSNFQCLTCSEGFFGAPYCLEECFDGYYKLDNECLPCDNSCALCTEIATNCSVCADDFVFNHNQQCVSHCESGFYANWESRSCEQCHDACQNCYGPSEEECYGCAEGFISLYNVCLKECPAGYFSLTTNSEQQECIDCPSSCNTCESREVCFSCKEGFFYVEEQQKCLAYCPPGFYADHDLKQCVSCGYQCSKCSNQVCSACSDGFVLNSEKQCVPEDSQQQCNNTQIEFNDECLDCPTNCTQCILKDSASGAVTTHCLECSGNFLLVNGLCKEPSGNQDGYYYDSDLGEYKPCNRKCATCESKYVCNTCKTGYFLQGDMCQEQCVEGYFIDQTNQSCQPCNDSCQTCFGPAETDCKVCAAGLIKHENQCIESCPVGTFLSVTYEQNFQSLKCLPCAKGCASCEGHNDICQECKPGFYSLWGDLCVEHCPEGTYPNREASICEPCSDICKKCSSATSCEVCHEGFFLQQPKTCVTECEPGFFANYETGRCEKCDYSVCSTCIQSPKTCLTCASDLMLINGVCQKQCPKGTYRSENSGNCEPCKEGCQECKGPYVTDCTVCKPGGPIVYSNLLQSCVEECEFGYYADHELGICNQCSFGCTSCANQFTCYECEQPLYLFTLPNNSNNPSTLPHSECLQYCPRGYYVEEQSRQCKPCKDGCSSCYETAFKCSDCQEGFVLYEEKQQCIQGECPSTHYLIAGENICHRCPENCRTCNADGCLTCANGLVFSNEQGVCVEECSQGYYRDNNSKSCQPCHDNCATCFGPGEFNCLECASDLLQFGDFCLTECKTGYFQIESRCERCSPNCKTCEQSPETCTDCFPGQELTNGTCGTADCIEGFYLSTTGCSKCSYSCTACYGPSIDECTDCKDTFYLDGSSCVRRCPASTYLEEAEGQCKSCPSQCSTCLNQYQCTSCKDGFYYLAEDYYCTDKCPENFFLNSQNTCQRCLEQCQTCSDYQHCTSCSPGFYLYNNWCHQECPSGLQADADLGVCAECQVENCQLCYDGFCEVCKQGYEIYYESSTSLASCRCQQGTGYYQGQCVRIPPLGYYINHETRNVEQCHSSCYSCFGPEPNQCTVCAEGTWLNDTDNSCGNECPAGFFDDGANNCSRCTDNCVECSDETSCTTCKPDFFLLDGAKCVPNCPFGKITNYQQRTCDDCQLEGCEFCINEGEFCEICQSDYIWVDGRCLTECPEGLIPLTQNNWTYCQKCSDVCDGCEENPYNCTGCIGGYFLQENGHCVPKCQPGFYGDSEDQTCKACDSACAICDGPGTNNCQRCTGDYALVEKTCTTECPAGFFIHSNSCKPCDKSCATCSGASDSCETCAEGFIEIGGSCQRCDSNCNGCENTTSNCLECAPNHYKNDGQCIRQCPDGTYGNQSLGTCQPCSVNCLSCFGPYNDQCTSCSQGFTGAPLCVLERPNCRPGQFLQINYSKESNNVVIGYDCVDCANNCAQCTEIDVCQVCKEGYTFTYDFVEPFYSCVQNLQCESGHYQTYDFQYQEFVCRPCYDGCASCELEVPFEPASLYCKECEEGLEFNPENPKTCLKSNANECEANQYALEVGTQVECIDCPEGCTTCAPNNNGKKIFCSACTDDFYLRKEKWCVKKCTEDQYMNANEKCKNCFRLCATCSGKGKQACTSCVDGYELQEDGSCSKIEVVVEIPDCIGEAFYHQRRQECKCKNKKLTYYPVLGCLTEEQWVEHTTCGVGEFFKDDIQSCVTCTTNNDEFLCKSCTGEKPSQCNQCVDGYYLDQASHTCLRCSANCAQCYSSDICEICEPGTFQYYGFSDSGRFEAQCHRQGCPTGTKPSLSSLYYLNPSLFVNQDGVEYNFYNQQQQDQTQQEGIAVAFGFYNEPIFSTEDLPWQYENGSAYYEGQQIILECTPCYDFCDSCIPDMFLIEAENRCVHHCPQNLIPTSTGTCIPVDNAQDDEVYVQYEHISANSDGVQEFSKPLIIQAYTESTTELDIHWSIRAVYSVEKQIELDLTQDEENQIFSGVDRDSSLLEIPANRLLKNRLYVFSLLDDQDFLVKIIVKQLPSTRPVEDIGIQPELIYIEPLEGIAEETEFIAKYIYNVPAISQSPEEWVFSIMVGDNSIPYQSRQFVDQLVFKAAQLPAGVDNQELAITFRARKGDEKFETKRYVTVTRNPDFTSTESEELEKIKERILDQVNAPAPTISELLHAAEIILNELEISDFSQAVKDQLKEFIDQIIVELQDIEIDEQNLLPIIKVLELAIEAEIFTQETQAIVETVIATLSSKIQDTTTFVEIIGTIERMNNRSKQNKVTGQTDENKEQTGIKSFNTVVESAKNWAKQFKKGNNKGVIDTEHFKGLAQNFVNNEDLTEITGDIETSDGNGINSITIDKDVFGDLDEVSLLSLVTEHDFVQGDGTKKTIGDITEIALIDSSTGETFNYSNDTQQGVEFTVGTAFENPTNGDPQPGDGKEFRCVYWDILNSNWSTEGLEIIEISDSYAHCSSNHLTSFSLQEVEKTNGGGGDPQQPRKVVQKEDASILQASITFVLFALSLYAFL